DKLMQAWRPYMPDFLDALLCRNGLGDYLESPACVCCGQVYDEQTHIFRCLQCEEFLQCQNCVRERHVLTPLHIVKGWNGETWTDMTLRGMEPNKAGLTRVGLVYQLGHHGFPCKFPKPKRAMVVLDSTGVHTVDVQFCGCEKSYTRNNVKECLANGWYPASTVDPETCITLQCLEEFCLLNVVANVNVQDYVGTLERKMDALRLSSIPDRYKVLGWVAQQFGFLKRAKRAGRGNATSGVRGTVAGGLGMLCWACPHDGKNLPDGWQDVDPAYRFLYMLVLALDANFRLKNWLRVNEHQDLSLGSGLGYFVESEAYKTHLRNYVAEKDVSSCLAFAALLQKETCLTMGLHVSGVRGCVCARHGVVRPLGMGDLQKGEQYANLDYIFLSALAGVAVTLLAISYNIACQWKINLKDRAKKIRKTTPITMRLEDFEIQYALPVWHAVAHEVTCQTQNSLSYAVGVGRTDGEGIERTWAVLNPVGYSTKEMGDGNRHDTIEDKIDHLNFEKNVREGDTLARKLIVVIAERDKQVADFVEVDRSLSKTLCSKWQGRIDKWLADPAEPNPYCLEGGKTGPSEAAVLLELKTAEAKDAAEGHAPLSDGKMMLSVFIKGGLQLEEAQRRIKGEIKGITLVTADRASQIQEMRYSLLRKICTYEKLQDTYMPGVAAQREEQEEARDPDVPAPKAEDIKLWMPSDLTPRQRRSAVRAGAAEAEARLREREAQCKNALDNLRSRLHAQRHIITWRNSNLAGQQVATRSATLIGRVGDRVARVANKYQCARAALIELKGESFRPQFKILNPEDLNVHQAEESDAKSRKKLARLGSRKSRNKPSTKRTTFSWIWTVGGGPGTDNAALHDSVRVEWSKAKAQRDRWVEEVQTLREEMKRVLRMLRWTQMEWRKRAVERTQVKPALAAGLKAYAMCQVQVHRRIAEAFHEIWSCSVTTAVRDVMRQDGTVYRELLDGHAMDSAPVVLLEEVEQQIEGNSCVLRSGTRAEAEQEGGDAGAMGTMEH
ncbi:hypothetical protein B0H17DRAFT_961868, partial [Mycena rosella]